MGHCREVKSAQAANLGSLLPLFEAIGKAEKNA
jgi:hypothetical protein